MCRKRSSIFVLIFLLLAGAMFITSTSAYAAKLTPEQKQLKKDKKYTGFMQKKIESMQAYLDKGHSESAKRSEKNAEKYYNKISDGYKKSAEVSKLKKRLDALKKKLVQMEAGAQAKIAESEALSAEKSTFLSIRKPYLKTYYLLEAGKTGEVGPYRSDHLSALKERLPEFKAFEAEFRKKLPNLIEKKPDSTHDGISVGDMLDAFKNADKYQMMFASALSESSLDELIARLSNNLKELKKGNEFPEIKLHLLYGPKAGNDFEEVKEVKAKAKRDGLPLPQEKIEIIDDYKTKLRNVLEQTAAKNTWKQKKASEYSYKNRKMKKSLMGRVKRKDAGLKLVEWGTWPEGKWRLVKNDLGIPLYKVSEGYALLQKKDEPFLRGYFVGFTYHFNGKDYESVPEVEMSYMMIPYKN